MSIQYLYIFFLSIFLIYQDKTVAAARITIEEDSNTPNISTESGSITLHEAAEQNNVRAILSLIKDKADIESRDKGDYTPLHRAIESDSLEAVRVLIKNGTSVHATRGILKDTPLHLTARPWQTHSLEIVKLLIDAGANINETNYCRRLPIDSLLDPYNYTPKSAQLIELLFDPNFVGEIPVLNHAIDEALISDNLEIVKLLLKLGANVEQKGKRSSESPIHKAVDSISKAKYQLVELLLSHGADINSRTEENETALHIAVKHNDIEMVKLLLLNKADISARDNDGYNSLHNAVDRGHLQLVELLLNSGISIDSQVEKADTIYHLNTSLHIAARRNRIDIFKLLLKRGANGEIKNKDGLSPLHLVCGYNNKPEELQVVDLLINSNADVNSVTGLKIGYNPFLLNETSDLDTPLHIATSYNNVPAIALLLLHGADTTLLNRTGQAPIHNAISRGASLDKVRLLSKYKSSINLLDRNRETPLHLACYSGNLGIIRELLNNGADKSLLKKTYRFDLERDCSREVNELLNTQDKAKSYKNEIYKACFGLKNSMNSTVVEPDIVRLKKLMRLCTVSLKFGEKWDNLLHILFTLPLTHFNHELIGQLIAINPDLLFTPNKLNITPIELAINRGDILNLLLQFCKK